MYENPGVLFSLLRFEESVKACGGLYIFPDELDLKKGNRTMKTKIGTLAVLISLAIAGCKTPATVVVQDVTVMQIDATVDVVSSTSDVLDAGVSQ